MTVIAMTREMGSRGRDVALGLAEELGLDLVQHQIVEHVADKMHVRHSAVNRFLEGKARLWERWGIKESDLSLYTTEEILELAEKGNVLIRGWGAAYVLRPVRHVICLRVCAPLELRARTLMSRVGLEDFELARREVERNDSAHTRTMSQMFHADWTQPELYDAVLNTERMPVEACVEVVVGLAAHPSFQETAESRAKLQAMKLEAEIRAALREHPSTSNPSPSFEIEVDPDSREAVLRGMIYSQEFSTEAERLVLRQPGIRSVVNEMRVIRSASLGV